MENEYITKEEVINQLKEKYKINISPRTLKYYGTVNLIEPGIRTYLKGIAGTVSYYKANTLLVITKIKELNECYGLTLKEIYKYKNWKLGEDEMFKDENGALRILNKVEKAKLQVVKDILET
jgi:DNA-binding transcriptional MerR regulator